MLWGNWQNCGSPKITSSQPNTVSSRWGNNPTKQLTSSWIVFNKPCSHATIKNIPSSKVEDATVIQGLILEIRDNKMRERLMTPENFLSIDSTSRIAYNCETIAHILIQLQTASISSHLYSTFANSCPLQTDPFLFPLIHSHNALLSSNKF